MEKAAPSKTAQLAAYAPPPDLQPFVHRILHGWRDSEQPSRLAIPPTGGIFVSYVRGAPLRVLFSDRVLNQSARFVIGGQLRREFPIVESLGRFDVIGTELTPTGFYRLFHSDADQYTDALVDLAQDFHTQAVWLNERLLPGTSVHETARILQDFLRSLVPGARDAGPIEAVIEDIVKHDGIVFIDDVARRQGLQTRSLRRDFVRIVGIPPKHYAKIVQVNAVTGALMANDAKRINDLALEHGYFDQSHFIRDFNRFVGMNPSEFLRSASAFLRTFMGRASR